MSDLTDERIAELVKHWGGYALEERATRTALLELQRHRTDQAADEERVRSVVREAGLAVERTAVTAVRIEKLDAIIDRAAKQLAGAGVRLTAEDAAGLQAIRNEIDGTWNLEPIPGVPDTAQWMLIRRGMGLLDRLLATVSP